MKLPQNVGTIDRIVRFVLGAALVGTALGGSVAAPVAYVAWPLAGIMLVTAAFGFCPLYWLLGISTAGNRLVIGRHSAA